MTNDDYWGYVTSGVTEGNMYGILLGREALPDAVLYASKEAHYTIFRIAKILRMEVVKIATKATGDLDCKALEEQLLLNKGRPAVVCATLGTAMKGAMDDVDDIVGVCAVDA